MVTDGSLGVHRLEAEIRDFMAEPLTAEFVI